MEAKTSRRLKATPPQFDVVIERTIGTVQADGMGEDNPFEAAFKLIGRSGDEGNFKFIVPKDIMGHDHDVTANVTVEYQADK